MVISNNNDDNDNELLDRAEVPTELARQSKGTAKTAEGKTTQRKVPTAAALLDSANGRRTFAASAGAAGRIICMQRMHAAMRMPRRKGRKGKSTRQILREMPMKNTVNDH